VRRGVGRCFSEDGAQGGLENSHKLGKGGAKKPEHTGGKTGKTQASSNQFVRKEGNWVGGWSTTEGSGRGSEGLEKKKRDGKLMQTFYRTEKSGAGVGFRGELVKFDSKKRKTKCGARIKGPERVLDQYEIGVRTLQVRGPL